MEKPGQGYKTQLHRAICGNYNRKCEQNYVSAQKMAGKQSYICHLRLRRFYGNGSIKTKPYTFLPTTAEGEHSNCGNSIGQKATGCWGTMHYAAYTRVRKTPVKTEIRWLLLV